MAFIRRYLDSFGAVASIIGLASIVIAVFTEYKVAALVTLFLTETVAIVIWWHWCRRRNRLVHPFDREDVLTHARYIFYSETKMTYELMEVARVTAPFLSALQCQLTWSGRGSVKVKSILSVRDEEIPCHFDGNTGKITFSIPFTEPKRFGETFASHFSLDLEDPGHKNIPKLCKSVKRPVQLSILEVFLRHCAEHSPARLVWQTIAQDSQFPVETLIKEVPFDATTRSFRAEIPRPVLGRSYQLVWG